MMGRIVQTIYILRYIHEEDLRRRVQFQLNRDESRHALRAGYSLATAASSA